MAESHHHGGWFAKWFHHHGHHHHEHDERNHRFQQHDDMGGAMQQRPRPPTVPHPEQDSQDARRDGADNADAGDAIAERYSDGDDAHAHAQFFLHHRGLVVLYAFGLAMIATLFFALRRHWLRRAAIADQQGAWVVVSSSDVPHTVLM
eukprot:Hpha_TRINITY_DN16841_c2_g2::TRINITY_DN16841_c2_g2_i1::g.149353::m.149353